MTHAQQLDALAARLQTLYVEADLLDTEIRTVDANSNIDHDLVFQSYMLVRALANAVNCVTTASMPRAGEIPFQTHQQEGTEP